MNYYNPSVLKYACICIYQKKFQKIYNHYIKKLCWYCNYCIGSDSFKGYVTNAGICNSYSQNKYECICSIYFKLLSSWHELEERAVWKYYLLCLLQNSSQWEYNLYTTHTQLIYSSQHPKASFSEEKKKKGNENEHPEIIL